MRNSVAFRSCGVGPAVRGVLSASVAESSHHLACVNFRAVDLFARTNLQPWLSLKKRRAIFQFVKLFQTMFSLKCVFCFYLRAVI